MSDKLKKQLILNLPYFLIGLYATKLGEEAVSSADDLSKRMKDYSDNNAKAEDMVAKIDKM